MNLDDIFNGAFFVKGTTMETCITNNNGHIVITGTVKSLRVNDMVFDIPTTANPKEPGK